MQKNMSVMNNLHQIGDRISASAKGSAEPETAPSSVNFPEITESKPVSKPGMQLQTLNDALDRRYEDYKRTKDDLTIRVTQALSIRREKTARMQQDLDALSPEMEKLVSFEQNLKDAAAPLDRNDPQFQSKLATRCLELDRMRIEVFRIIAPDDLEKQAGTVSIRANNVFDPSVQPFSVLFRCGCAFMLPLILALIGCTLLLGFAIIAAFNGTIRW